MFAISHSGSYFVGQSTYGDESSLFAISDLNDVVGSFDVGSFVGTAAFSTDDSLLYEVQGFGGYNGQNAFKVFNVSTFTQLDSFVDPSPNASTGYSETVTGLVVTAPNGYLYVAETDGTFNDQAGSLELVSTQRAPFFNGSVALSDGFYYLKFSDGVPFGYYNFNFTPYLITAT